MFSEKTIQAAINLKKAQAELESSIREDLGITDCALCSKGCHEQLWFDDEIPKDNVLKMLNDATIDKSSSAKYDYLRYRIGPVPFVTLVGKD